MVDKAQLGAASALAGATIFSVHSMYVQHAGSLADCRNAPAGDPVVATRLRDADILTGVLVLVVGGFFAAATGSKEPLVITLSAFAVTATYYHLVCNSVNVDGEVHGA